MRIDVLLVDDLAFTKLVLRDIVEHAGFKVIGEASDGDEAVLLFEQHKPDVVILDVTMPKVDGLEALKQMLAIDPSARVIMCSALGQQKLIMSALDAGARDYIVKPFKPERVVSAIKQVLDIA